MQLKSLEIQGFKSFPDRLKIGFGSGITAIVGPNGSGKSNISDAIRWVLGEQSTRNLRGSRMEDVIFGGTADRKPVGFAEVSITIDNSGGELPTEYNEVVVTRRYFRSGESEFYINRQTVRLKDIHELFMDTGLGRDGYSIIGQGRITEVLASKSEDRRDIFEEASGISKYRYRKETAEKRIEATETNLVRIRDITLELENQLEPLRVQAEKAKRYLALEEELKSLETDVWAVLLTRIKENRAKLEENIGLVTRELKGSAASLETAYSLIETASGGISALDSKMQELREAVREAETARNEAVNDKNVVQTKISANNESIERFKSEILSRGLRSDQLNSQLEAYRNEAAENEALEGTLELERQTLAQKYEGLVLNSDDTRVKIDALRNLAAVKADEMSVLLQERSSVEAMNSSASERSAALNNEYAQRNVLLDEQRTLLCEAEANLAESRARADAARNVMNGYELRIASRTERLNRSRDELSRMEREFAAKSDRHNMLAEMEREYEGFSGAVRRVMQQSRRRALSGVLGTVSELVSANEEYAVAIETALGGAMQHIAVEDENAAKSAIQYLKAENAGRATFLPLTSVKGTLLNERGLSGEAGYIGVASELVTYDPVFKGIFASLLGRTAVVENIDVAISVARKYSYRFRIVTLDGQVVNAGGSMTGGAVSHNIGLISRGNEIKRLEGETAELTEKKEVLAGTVSELERELNAANYEYELAGGELREAEDSVLGLEGGLAQQKSRIKGIETDIDMLKTEKERILNSGALFDTRLAEIAVSVTAFTDEKMRLEESARELSMGQDILACEQGGLSTQIEDIRVKLAEAIARREAGKRGEDDLLRVIADLENESGSGEKMIEQLILTNAELTGEESRLNLEIGKLARKLETLGKGEKELVEKRLIHEAERSRNERESRSLNERCMTLERERQRLERDRLNLDTEEQTIVERMWESYELIPSRVLETARPLESREAALRCIGSLKTERRNMGSVNVDAAPEYEQVSSRYQFLLKQRDDLEKSKVELEGIIIEVVSEMTRIFSEKFRLIQESFTKTFVDMFGGGKAELILTEPNDVLNSGIDIRVQPPGKNVKIISLFSGGEMALVAIALFFAIFRVRPAPFCVLDEVDSALDDLNVQRFASYISGLVPETQLIIITHRRGTMEHADILYGVTMQEKGVSKLLTMNIPEIERELNIKLE